MHKSLLVVVVKGLSELVPWEHLHLFRKRFVVGQQCFVNILDILSRRNIDHIHSSILTPFIVLLAEFGR